MGEKCKRFLRNYWNDSVAVTEMGSKPRKAKPPPG
jgi:hypothetical protein